MKEKETTGAWDRGEQEATNEQLQENIKPRGQRHAPSVSFRQVFLFIFFLHFFLVAPSRPIDRHDVGCAG